MIVRTLLRLIVVLWFLLIFLCLRDGESELLKVLVHENLLYAIIGIAIVEAIEERK